MASRETSQSLTSNIALLGAALLLTGLSGWAYWRGYYSWAVCINITGALLLSAAAKPAPQLLPSAADLFLLIIIFVAVAMRFYALGEYPPGFSGHATAQFGTRRDFMERFVPALVSSDWAQARVYWRAILGEETGPVGMIEGLGFFVYGVSTETTRYMPAIIGSLTVVLAYFLGRAMHSRLTGAVFALLIALAPWHLAVSRYDNLEHVMPLFHLLATLLLLHHAMTSGKKILYCLAGVFTGFSLYVYATNQIIPILACLYLLRSIFVERSYLKRNAINLTLFCLCASAAIYPQLNIWLDTGHYLPVRKPNAFFEISFQDISARLHEAISQLFFQVSDPWYEKPGAGLGAAELLFCIPGLIAIIAARFRYKDRKLDIALLWLLCAPLAPLLAPDVPFRRLMLVAGSLSFCAAWAIGLALGPLQGRFRADWFIKPLLAVAAIFMFTRYSARVYFRDVTVHETCSSIPRWMVARKMSKALKEGDAISIVPQELASGTFDILEIEAYEQLKASTSGVATESPRFQILTPETCAQTLNQELAKPFRQKSVTVMLPSDSLLQRECEKIASALAVNRIEMLPAPRCSHDVPLAVFGY